MNSAHRKALAATGLSAVAIFGVAACSSGSATEASSSSASASSSSAPAMTSAAPSSSAAADPAADLVGTGCAGYAEKVPRPGLGRGHGDGPGRDGGLEQPRADDAHRRRLGQAQPRREPRRHLNGGEFTVIA